METLGKGHYLELLRVNGWEYVSESNSIVFNGSAVPAQGASILVDFDPVSLIN